MNGNAWTRDEISELVTTYEQRLPIGALADRLNRTVAAVEAKAGRLGLALTERSESARLNRRW